MVDWKTPKLVIDPIRCNNPKENWYMGQCPLCKYCVINDVDKNQCNFCGQYLKWPVSIEEWRNANS